MSTGASASGSSGTSGPRFTVVIPTRNRAFLARRSIARALDQTLGDLEVLVLENSDTPELSGLSDDPRLRVLPSPSVLSMPDNWERGIDAVRGLYVLFLSDRDLLVHDALERIWEASEGGTAGMVHFHKSDYHNGRLIYRETDGSAETRLARSVLVNWYEHVEIAAAPMIYSAAAHTAILRGIRQRYGRFFVGTAPDVASGPLLAASMERYRLLNVHVTVSWRGEWSIGTDQAHGKGGASRAFLTEFGRDPYAEAGVVISLAGTIAETLTACRTTMPELLEGCEVNWQAYLRTCIRELQARQKYGVDISADLARLEAGAGERYSRADVRRALFMNRKWMRKLFGSRSRLRYFDGRKVRLEFSTVEEALAAIEAVNAQLDAGAATGRGPGAGTGVGAGAKAAAGATRGPRSRAELEAEHA